MVNSCHSLSGTCHFSCFCNVSLLQSSRTLSSRQHLSCLSKSSCHYSLVYHRYACVSFSILVTSLFSISPLPSPRTSPSKLLFLDFVWLEIHFIVLQSVISDAHCSFLCSYNLTLLQVPLHHWPHQPKTLLFFARLKRPQHTCR